MAGENSRDIEQLQSDRLGVFLAGGMPSFDIGTIAVEAASLGTPEEWQWSAYVYCTATLFGTQGGTLGGKVEVSAAALGILLNFTERLAIAQGIIPAPGGAS